MRKNASYLKKYGDLTPHTALQREAALARWEGVLSAEIPGRFRYAVPCPFTARADSLCST